MRFSKLNVSVNAMTRCARRFLLVVCLCVLASENALAQRTLAITGATVETASSQGALENATILIQDGKIEAIGSDVKIPVAAQVVDATGKTIMPGLVDAYYVVTIGRNTQPAATRTVVFGGRVFVIGGGPPSIATTFAKVADGLDLSSEDWRPAIRSGTTTFHVVTGGYAQSMVAKPSQAENSVDVEETDGSLLVTVSNDTKSLDVLRNNLKPADSGSGRSGRPGVPSGRSVGSPAGRPTSASRPSSPTAEMWAAVRDGKAPVFVNVNNASAILHADAILAEYPKAKIALIADGPNVYNTLKSLDEKRYTVILPPAIDRKPNSADRVNVPKLLAEKGINFVLSCSLGQSDFRVNQPTPLFGPAMLIRTGLDRQKTIRSLTIEPAKLLGMEKEVGSLEVGKQANLVVFDEDPFSATANIDQVYVSGELINE